MAVFSGKIIEAKFLDRQKTMIEILYEDFDKIVAHSIEVDWELKDFHDLLEEMDLEDIERQTIIRNQDLAEQKKAAVNATVEARLADGFKEKAATVDVLIKEVIANRHDESFLFRFKAEIFKMEEVSLSYKWFKKRRIQKSKDALEILAILYTIIK